MNRKRVVDGNTNTGVIKLVAVFFMIVDHAGKLFFSSNPAIPEMRILGRIAFPLFAWGIVVGCEYTKNIWKYLLRILLTGIISQPIFMLALRHPWNNVSLNDPATWFAVGRWGELNIFFTLFLGLFAIACIRQKSFFCQYWGPALAILATMILKVDYGWKGVLLLLLLYGARKDRTALAAVMLAFCLFWGSSSGNVSSLFGIKISAGGILSPLIGAAFKVQFFAVLALPLMLIRMKGHLHVPKWVSYSIYPFHLLVLYLIGLL